MASDPRGAFVAPLEDVIIMRAHRRAHRRFLPGILAATVMVATSVHAQAQSDHLKCYRAKDLLKVTGTAELDTPQFGVDPGCKISKARFFCAPGTKTDVAVIDKMTKLPLAPLPVGGPDPGDRICYKVRCPRPATPIADQTVTDQFGTRTATILQASYICTPAFKGSARFVDNGNGTVTDHYTGPQWEQKTNADSVVNFDDPHDVDNTYVWSSSGTALDGPVITDFLAKLNDCASDSGETVTAGGFAGHCDWRLPRIDELQTIVDSNAAACQAPSYGPCIDPVFGPTYNAPYWSGTTATGDPRGTWVVAFVGGGVAFGFKTDPQLVRAVRAGGSE
jgi:Protein of unknown function (DUF1566)